MRGVYIKTHSARGVRKGGGRSQSESESERESEIDREGEEEGELPWNEKKHECLCQEEVARMLCRAVLWCSRRRLWRRL